jgi:release factor glutamine methyltransferase
VVAELRRAGCVFAEEEAAVILEAATGDDDAVQRFVAERVAGRPLEHVVGWADFAGIRVKVGPGVFVPRRRTELLVREAVADARPGAVVVDLCCGSGAIGAAIDAFGQGRVRLNTDADGDTVLVPVVTAAGHEDREHGHPGFEVWAADIDPAAVATARRNLAPERVFEGDLFDALPRELRGRVDVLAVNAPYVPSDAITTMPAEARLHEAHVALDGGSDGLDVQRRVVTAAAEWLAPGGRLLIETSECQAGSTAAMMRGAGLEVRVQRDESIDGTVVIGRR